MYLDSKNQFKLFPSLLDFFQNDRGIRLVSLNDKIRIIDNLWNITIESFIVIWMSFFDMQNSFICNNNLICYDIFRDTPINVLINFSY